MLLGKFIIINSEIKVNIRAVCEIAERRWLRRDTLSQHCIRVSDRIFMVVADVREDDAAIYLPV